MVGASDIQIQTMKNLFSILAFAVLATTGQSQTLWSFRVPVDGLVSNGVAVGTTAATAPTFTPSSGAVPLDVSVVSVGNMVFVTTNGTTPTTNLTPYASGTLFSVTSTNEPLRAIAWTNSDGRLPSSVTSAYYTNAVAGSYSLVASNVDTTSHDYRTLGNTEANQFLATKFTAPESATLTKIDLLLGKVGLNGSPTGQLTLRLMGSTATDATAAPTNILATATATANAASLASIGTSNWVEFAFSGAPVTNAAVYWLALETTQAPSVLDYVGWWAPNVFVNAGAYNSTNGVLWTDVLANQLNFKAWKE
jgi:hypothetical protein